MPGARLPALIDAWSLAFEPHLDLLDAIKKLPPLVRLGETR